MGLCLLVSCRYRSGNYVRQILQVSHKLELQDAVAVSLQSDPIGKATTEAAVTQSGKKADGLPPNGVLRFG